MARQLDRTRAGATDKKGGASESGAVSAEPPPKKRGKLKLIIIIAVVLVVLGGGGGGAYFFMFAGNKSTAPKEVPPAQPFFVEVKPFVVTMKAGDDSMHYVQLALSLKVPSEESVADATAVMPELLDMIRQQVLGFKIEDLQTQQGVEQLRKVVLEQTNRVLLQSLGKTKVEALGGKNDALVSNIFFQNLVIE